MLTTVDTKTLVILTVDVVLAPDECFTVIAAKATFTVVSIKAIATHPTREHLWSLVIRLSGEGHTASATMRGLPRPVREHLTKTLWDAGVEQWTDSA